MWDARSALAVLSCWTHQQKQDVSEKLVEGLRNRADYSYVTAKPPDSHRFMDFGGLYKDRGTAQYRTESVGDRNSRTITTSSRGLLGFRGRARGRLLLAV